MAQNEPLVVGDRYWPVGADSWSLPEVLGEGEYVAGMNIVCRGGIVQTRPGTRSLYALPTGNIQGFTLFTPGNGVPHHVAAVDGYIYVSSAPFTTWRRLPNIRFNNTSRFVCFENCLKSTTWLPNGEFVYLEDIGQSPYHVLVMQDGATRAAYWDGSISRHLNPSPSGAVDAEGEGSTVEGMDETYIGLWMKWSGNRLWVSRDNRVFASDIGDPLKFTEAQYINEGRAFYLSGDCTGMVETPLQDGLIVFTETNGSLLQSNIQDRTLWLQTPNFQKIVFPHVGCAAPLSIVTQYGLIWWFSPMGFINSDQALSLNRTSRMDYQDNEMACSKGNIGPDIAGICTVAYENYILCSVPSGDVFNRHTWCLDQAPFEGVVNSWNSYWTGWRPVQWATGQVNGTQRTFFISKDFNGCTKVWEANLSERTDNGAPITCFCQFKQHDFGRPNFSKRFTFAELYLQEVLGDVSLMLAVGGRKGGYTRILTSELAATEGGIYADTIYDAQVCMGGHRPQVRALLSQENVLLSRCNNGAGVESDNPNDIDFTFGLLAVWSGRMAVNSYAINTALFGDPTNGTCERMEVHPNSLSDRGCAQKAYIVNTCAFPLFEAYGSAEAYCENSQSMLLGSGYASSIISQVDADRKAYFAAYNEAVQRCQNCTPIVYFNTPQRYVAVCPEGLLGPNSVATIPARAYTSTVSQADANAQALAAATQAAIAGLVCQSAFQPLFLRVEGELVAIGATIDFGSIPEETEVVKNATLTNEGDTDVTVSSINLGGSFAVQNIVPPLPVVLGPGESISFDIVYLPPIVAECPAIAQTWQANVLANGGVLGPNSLEYACNLMTTMQARSYYPKIRWLNLYLGDNDAARKVPIIGYGLGGVMTGPALTGTEPTGFTSTAPCGTGVTLSEATGGGNSAGLGAWVLNIVNTPNNYLMGNNLVGPDQFDLLAVATTLAYFTWGEADNAAKYASQSAAQTPGFFYGQAQSMTNKTLWKNGVQIGSTGTMAATPYDSVFYAFGLTDSSATNRINGSRIGLHWITDGQLTPLEIQQLYLDFRDVFMIPAGRI